MISDQPPKDKPAISMAACFIERKISSTKNSDESQEPPEILFSYNSSASKRKNKVQTEVKNFVFCSSRSCSLM